MKKFDRMILCWAFEMIRTESDGATEPKLRGMIAIMEKKKFVPMIHTLKSRSVGHDLTDTEVMRRLGKPDEPQYWNLLDDNDKGIYRRISAALSAPRSRNRGNKRMEDFREIIDALEVFENADAEGKWKRCLVCGTCKLTNGIAVNTTQLKRLVFKCKSSINGSLKGLGYALIITGPSAGEELLNEIPYLRQNPAEFRRWTIRTTAATDRTDMLLSAAQRALNEAPPRDSEAHGPQVQSPEEWLYDSVYDDDTF
jgi:hypothetical protein